MARDNTSGCLCRVPITEASVPDFGNEADLKEWAGREGVDLALDHLNRWSIPLAAAYELRDKADAAAASHAAYEAERVAREKAVLADAQARRQSTFDAAYRAACRRGKGSSEASMVAWEAVHKAERSLPELVRVRLAGVRIPTMFSVVD